MDSSSTFWWLGMKTIQMFERKDSEESKGEMGCTSET